MRTVVLLILAAFTINAADRKPASEWRRTDLSVAQRDALVEQGRSASFSEIAPILLEVLVKHRPTFGHYNHSGDKPWNSDLLKGGARNYVMADVVWAHHMRQRDDPERARVLLRLFQTHKHPDVRFRIVDSMTHDHWIPEMESVLAPLLDDSTIHVESRHTILIALLERVDLNKYLHRVIRFVREEKDWYERLRYYNRLTNFGNRAFTLTKANRKALLDLGFQLLEDIPRDKLQRGYFVARQLGFFVKAKNTFAPDQSAPQYQGEGKLKDSFFEDTVRNALAWRRQNRSEE